MRTLATSNGDSMNATPDRTAENKTAQKPKYETPRIEMLSEKEILSRFQVTQAMATWWGAC